MNEIRYFDTGIGLMFGTILTFYHSPLFTLVTGFSMILIWVLIDKTFSGKKD